MSEFTTLLKDLALVESPRWHDDRLVFSDWGAGEIVAVDLDGQHEVISHDRCDAVLPGSAARRAAAGRCR